MKALRGIVRLQALVRGRLVRKQLAVTLKCMHALLRVQERAREQRARSSADGHGSQVPLKTRATSTKDAEVYGLQHQNVIFFSDSIRSCNAFISGGINCRVRFKMVVDYLLENLLIYVDTRQKLNATCH